MGGNPLEHNDGDHGDDDPQVRDGELDQFASSRCGKSSSTNCSTSSKHCFKVLKRVPHCFASILIANEKGRGKVLRFLISSPPSGNARGAKEPERRHSLYDSASRGQYKVSRLQLINERFTERIELAIPPQLIQTSGRRAWSALCRSQHLEHERGGTPRTLRTSSI